MIVYFNLYIYIYIYLKAEAQHLLLLYSVEPPYTTKKSSCPSVFFPAFLQTAVIDKPIPALFVGALQSAAIGGLQRRFSKNASIGSPKALGQVSPFLYEKRSIPTLLKALEQVEKRQDRSLQNAEIGHSGKGMRKTYPSAFKSAGIGHSDKGMRKTYPSAFKSAEIGHSHSLMKRGLSQHFRKRWNRVHLFLHF